MSVIFLFIDGIGLGEGGEENPLSDPSWESFRELTRGQGLTNAAVPVFGSDLYFAPVDASLDTEGLPQSGTGQTSLFTGINAARMAGRHYGPWPHTKTKHLFENQSLFHQVADAGLTPHFINAYPEVFFDRVEESNRWTSTTLMARSSGQVLNGVKELREGRAVTAEITQRRWKKSLYPDIPEITPEEAAERVLSALDMYDLVLYEYYLTDMAGHSMSREMSREILDPLDRFITRLLQQKKRRDHLVLCSDHGNLEDLTTKTHTRNPVPLIVQGEIPPGSFHASSITDVPAIIMKLLTGGFVKSLA